MKKALAVVGIVLVLTGTYLIYASSQTKGTAAVYGPTPGTPEEKAWRARQARYARMAATGYVVIVIGSLMGIPLIFSTP